MKTLNLMFMLGFPLAVTAQNPIIHNQFAADPTARVFNNRVYVPILECKSYQKVRCTLGA